MCGICGKTYSSKNKVDKNTIHSMTDALIHRGPDDEDFYFDQWTGLGHRRLSIIDLSPVARQPLSSPDNSLWLVFNGMIYNYRELKNNQLADYPFKTKTDSEVILALYQKHGIECLHYLDGMFAFAIWDKKKKRLFAARDRMGQKPLFYHSSHRCFTFASELNSLMKDKNVPTRLDYDAVDLFLEYQYIPSPYTIYREVRQLEPGHFLLYQSGNLTKERYWRLNFPQKKLDLSHDELLYQSERRIRDAIKKRLRADVPVGVLLSGGVDSSLVTATMAESSSEKIETFSVGFEDKAFNELPYARQVAEKYDTEHHEIIIKPDFGHDISVILNHYGQPFGDKSAIPSFYVCRMAGKKIKVALNGDGGDEICAGYTRFDLNKWAFLLYKYPGLRKIFLRLTNLLPEASNEKNLFFRLKRKLKYQYLSPESREIEPDGYWSERYKRRLYKDSFRSQLQGGTEAFRKIKYSECLKSTNDLIERIQSLIYKSYLPDCLQVKMDIASMANSLEGRSPLLDYQLVEFFAQIPSEFKVRGGEKKYILKKLLEKRMGKKFVYRSKQGFSVPIDNWVRNRLSDHIENYVFSSRFVKEHFDVNFIRQLYQRHTDHQESHGYRMWLMLALGIWLKMNNYE